MLFTYYIVPALTDVAGQCRIVARLKDDLRGSARENYRKEPAAWKEVGIMDSRGKLVCLDTKAATDELRSCEPLMAGLEIDVDVPENPS